MTASIQNSPKKNKRGDIFGEALALRVLFLPSHVGLGHVTRDIAIARWVRRREPRVIVEWCSAEPVTSYLRLWGERVLECSYMLKSFSEAIEGVYNYYGYSLKKLSSYLEILRENYRVVEGHVDFNSYDLVFADEFWELVLSAPTRVKEGVVFGTDLVFKPYELNPLGNIIGFILNHYFKKTLPLFRRLVYLNSLHETPSTRWYLLFGERVREWVRKHMFVTGLATSYLPGDLPGIREAKKNLGFGEDSKIVAVSVGGTATRSKLLIEKALRAHEILRKRGVDVKLVVVAGPRTRIEETISSDNIVFYRVERNLWNLYMASNVFVTRAGRTTTADLECLPRKTRAILVPIGKHFEQEHIARMVASRYPDSFYYLREDVEVGTLAETIEKLLGEGDHTPKTMGEDCGGSINAGEYLLKQLKTAQ